MLTGVGGPRERPRGAPAAAEGAAPELPPGVGPADEDGLPELALRAPGRAVCVPVHQPRGKLVLLLPRQELPDAGGHHAPRS
jgi:hypothetical protein